MSTLSQGAVLSAAPTSPQLAPDDLKWPLVGRAEELQEIARARAEGRCAVVLGAAAGVGKSRLAREALAQAEDGGAYVAWVQATRSAAAVPLGAFVGILPETVRSDQPLELMRGSARFLQEQAGGRPIVLGVDDAQLLDGASAALVLHLATSRAAFALASVRSGEQCPDAIVSLSKDAGAVPLELAPLSEEAVAELVESALGGPVELAVRRWVSRSSAGNALYVRELLFSALRDGALTQVAGLWRLVGQPPPSRSIVQLITSRMEVLGDGERRVIELLSLGEPLGLGELVRLTSSDAIAGAERDGMVTVGEPARGGEVRLAHPLYGEAVRASLSVAQAREDRLRLAALVRERRGRGPDDALRIARWLVDAGEEVPTELLLDAARAAILSGDPDLGAELAGRASAFGAIDAVLLLARAHIVRKRFDEAERLLAGIEEQMAKAPGGQATAVEYIEQRAASVLYWGLRRPHDALELVERAWEWWPESSWRRKLDPIRLHITSVIDGFSGLAAVAGEILADPDLDADTYRRMAPVQAVNLFYSGRTQEAYELGLTIRPSLPIADESDLLALSAWAVIGIESGRDWAALERWGTEMLQGGIRANDHAAAGIGAVVLGGLRLMEGRYEDASRWFAEAEVHYEQRDAFGTLVIVHANQVGIAYYTGDLDGALQALERSRAALAGSRQLRTQIPHMARAEAWAQLAQGDEESARELLMAGAREIEDIPVYAAQLHYEALRAGGRARELAPPLTKLQECCDARLVAAYAGHARALAANDGRALLASAEEMRDIGALRYGMEAAADASRAFREEGREDSARRAAALSRELYERGQGGRPPEIEGLDSARLTLTRREAQLVDMAAQGLSNAEIADRLVLSVRTVESHLYRAMQKLGISDRRELRAS